MVWGLDGVWMGSVVTISQGSDFNCFFYYVNLGQGKTGFYDMCLEHSPRFIFFL
jgi:hypothetical protein